MSKRHFYFGIVGTGVIAHFHAQAIAQIPTATLAGVYSTSQEKSTEFASKYGGVAYRTIEELAVAPQIDIVCICTPSGIHMEPALRCIEGGKHCLIEKPLEVNLERCDRILKAANIKGVKIGVIFPSRFYPAGRQLKKAIDEKRFGNLVLGDAYVKWNRDSRYYKSAKWRGTWEFDGGGALMNQGIHSVDLLQWYMGPVQSVQSVAANVRHKEIEVEDTIVSTLKFANGALGTIECTTAAFPGSARRIEIHGTGGTAIIEDNDLVKWQFNVEKNGDLEMKNLVGESVTRGGASNPADINFIGHQKQIEDMMNSIEVDRVPLIDGYEGRKSVEIVLAIYESAKSGAMVTLSEPT